MIEIGTFVTLFAGFLALGLCLLVVGGLLRLIGPLIWIPIKVAFALVLAVVVLALVLPLTAVVLPILLVLGVVAMPFVLLFGGLSLVFG